MQGLDRLAFSPAQVREFDRIAIEVGGIPGYTLMSRAGEAVLRAARERFPAARRWLVLCGAGNNAGDGYVVARLAQAAGIDCRVAALSDPAKLGGDAAHAWRDFREAGGEAGPFEPAALERCDLLVDALLGTGLDRPLAGRWLDCVQTVAASGRPVVAVDIPTGLHGGTGEVLGAAVPAVLTVTFVGLKQGLFLGHGPDYRGELRFDPLGIPPDLLPAARPAFALYAAEELAAWLSPRPATAHKGLFGHVLVIGGNVGMGGAARLAGEAALRAGAGLVSVATHPDNAAALLASRPELMSRGASDAAALAPLLSRASVIALGPGLGRDAWAEAMFDAALAAPQPKILDADALNRLAERPQRRDDWILTPHPGEAARLLGCTAADVQQDRLGAVAALGERYGGVVLLKGRGTLVGRSGATPWLIDRGNPGMATAGMGDVLTGVIAGLLAQRGGEPLAAAAAGAWAHAVAGDRAALAGQRGLLASDLLAELRACLNP
ncbi:MAG: NAD(P)H-hydrate dehydratase [Gammaproteobacteria bacterium]|nr:MAG: NAD(P)H-hydrate dehydratase [Gammaproteobacteria bacterium]